MKVVTLGLGRGTSSLATIGFSKLPTIIFTFLSTITRQLDVLSKVWR